MAAKRSGVDMAQKHSTASTDIKACDPAWTRLREEAEELCSKEPVLASFVYSTILNRARLEVRPRLGESTT